MLLATVPLLNPNATSALAILRIGPVIPGLSNAVRHPLMVEKPFLKVPYAIATAPPSVLVPILAGVLGSPLGAFLTLPDLPD